MPLLTVGDSAPAFSVPSTVNPTAALDEMGGSCSLLFFFGSSQIEHVTETLEIVFALQTQFEHRNLRFFGISIDPNDLYLKEQIENTTHCGMLWDFQRTVSSQYGVSESLAAEGINGHLRYKLTTFVVDENLRIRAVFPFEEPTGYVERLLETVETLTAPANTFSNLATRQAPVLFVPNVFDRDFCQFLIQQYERNGGRESGFMQTVGDKLTEVTDPQVKRRKDWVLADADVLKSVNDLLWRRVKPEIEKAFQFSITNFERYVVGCYDEGDRGFFKAHRDNTLPGTGHRRFAMTLNLNTEAYDGGHLRFPEYGSTLYRPDTGEAIIFSCALLHEAMPVTQGRRFALLTFFYGEAEAKLRAQEQQQVIFGGASMGQVSKQARSITGNAAFGFQGDRTKKKKR
ncbi:2OG-Fe(II) oxygenase [Phormidium sp. CLA17]|uniref:2OG-Fe(II) oxygenase n=1 Tax=Leptolyngbya sp. Cla-17 TaxID=2803751 RepID=UPI0014910D63|nr:2OG-Fe(II) oxygenase [Leptolyngbya sp. Cla-17]MBM0743175.1 2OG-Fe(II) oxygenase [Leptolyngbya sp. Cla-17]